MRVSGLLLALVTAACTTAPAPGGSIEGRWRVVAVNGRATPTQGDYQVSFEDGRIGARFGCNHVGGSYRLSGANLRVSDLSQTLMGCPEPAISFETQGAAVLGQAMTVSRPGSGQVTLSNAAGSFQLQRAN